MNIKQIAKIAGVSTATVSRYLNNGYVSEGKRALLAKIIEEQEYKPLFQARTLKSKKTNQIAVIIPKLNSNSISRMVSGISERLRKENIFMLLANTENDEQEELAYLEMFQETHVDGIILIATVLTKQHYKVMETSKVPIVVLGQETVLYNSVYFDDYSSAKKIGELVAKTGSVFGYIGVDIEDKAMADRGKGYMSALAENDKTISEVNCKYGGFDFESGYEGMKDIVANNPNVDTVFCVTDTISAGGISYLNSVGINVPEDVQVVGMGDSKYSEITNPPLTTIHFNYWTSGRFAADILLDKISGENAIVGTKLGFEVVKRGSHRE